MKILNSLFTDAYNSLYELEVKGKNGGQWKNITLVFFKIRSLQKFLKQQNKKRFVTFSTRATSLSQSIMLLTGILRK